MLVRLENCGTKPNPLDLNRSKQLLPAYCVLARHIISYSFAKKKRNKPLQIFHWTGAPKLQTTDLWQEAQTTWNIWLRYETVANVGVQGTGNLLKLVKINHQSSVQKSQFFNCFAFTSISCSWDSTAVPRNRSEFQWKLKKLGEPFRTTVTCIFLSLLLLAHHNLLFSFANKNKSLTLLRQVQIFIARKLQNSAGL